jgi:hypothetical protein
MYDDRDIFGDNYLQNNLNQQSIQPGEWKEPYSYESEPFLQKLIRSLGTGVAQAPNVLGVPGSIAEWTAGKTAGRDVNIPYLPTMSKIKKARQAFSEKYLPDKNYLEPNDFLSGVAANVGGDLPYIAATGVPGLLKSLGSGAAMSGVEKMGGGAIPQLAAGMLTSGGMDFARRGGLAGKAVKEGQKGGMFDLDSLTDFGQRTKKSAYESAYGVGKNIKIPDKNLAPALDGILTNAQKDLSKAEYKTLYDEIVSLGKNISKGKIDGETALRSRHKFNRLSKDAYRKGDKELGSYYEKVAKGLRSTVGIGSELSKDYGKFVGLGDEMVKSFADPNKVTQFFENATSLNLKNPLTKLLLMGVGGGIGTAIGKNPIGAGLGVLGGYTAGTIGREISRVGELAYKSPTIRKHLKEIGKNMAKDQLKQASFNIMKLDKELSKTMGNGMPYTWTDV